MAKKKKAGRPAVLGAGEKVQVRLDAETLARVDALTARMDGDAACMVYGGCVSRSSALRLALLAGLDALEKKRSAQ